jgi:hypothetical protein
MGLRIAILAFAMSTIAAGPVLADEMSDLKTYCKADIQRLCKNSPLDQIKSCLKKHQKEMSVGCAQALKKLKG